METAKAAAAQPTAGHSSLDQEPASQPGNSGFLTTWFRRRVRHTVNTQASAEQDLASGNYERAHAQFEAILEAQPDSVPARRGISRALMHLGGRDNLKAAAAHMMQACQTDPYDARLYHMLSAIYTRMGMVKRALTERHNAAIVRTLAAKPRNDVAHNCMGMLLCHLFLPDLAIEHFRKSVALNPQYEAAFRNLAVTLYYKADACESGKDRSMLAASALHAIRQGLAACRSARSLIVLALVYELSGLYTEALAAVQEAEQMEARLHGLAPLKSRLLRNAVESARYAVRPQDEAAVESLRQARERVAQFDLGL